MCIWQWQDGLRSGRSNGSKKRLNVDSPSFTPSLLAANGTSTTKKTTTISPKAANAAPFLPKSVASRMVPSSVCSERRRWLNVHQDLTPALHPYDKMQLHRIGLWQKYRILCPTASMQRKW